LASRERHQWLSSAANNASPIKSSRVNMGC
jgi:hypothetical protein